MRKVIFLLLLITPLCLFADDAPLERLSAQIKSAGIPLDYVIMNGDKKDGINLVFLSSATSNQKSQAQTILSNFDMSPPPEKTIAELMAEYNALSSSDQKQILAAIVAFTVKTNPPLMERWLSSKKGN